MNSCLNPQQIVKGTADNSSKNTEIHNGKAIFVSKGNGPNLQFKSYAEKYAYYRGKSTCEGGPAYPCPQ
jgi:hypothetical protein